MLLQMLGLTFIMEVSVLLGASVSYVHTYDCALFEQVFELFSSDFILKNFKTAEKLIGWFPKHSVHFLSRWDNCQYLVMSTVFLGVHDFEPYTGSPLKS